MSSGPADLPPGWSRPRPEHLPRPTATPSLFALGVTVFAWGVVASALLLFFGGALTAFTLGQWVREIRNDARSR